MRHRAPHAGPVGGQTIRLTDRTDYALRVLMYLAMNGEGLVTIGEIAKRYGVSKSHLNQITWELGRAGFVKTVRGKGGGLRLARPAEAISVGAVARHAERSIPLAECFPGGAGGCRIASCCIYRRVLAEAEAAFFAELDRYTVRDLVVNNPALRAVLLSNPP